MSNLQNDAHMANGMPVDMYVLDIENLSHIQRDILIRLKTADTAAYTDLKTEDLTGNAFNYHLRHVIAEKLIEKTDDQRYQLTAKGRLLIDNVSLESMRLKLRPTVGMILILRSEEYGTLLYHANRAPLRGLVGLPFGKLRLGDTLENTFQRMLKKRGIHSDDLKCITSLGMVNIRYFDRDQLVVHRNAAVWTSDYSGTGVVASTDHGRSFWSKNIGTQLGLLSEVEAVTNWPQGYGSLEISSSLPG